MWTFRNREKWENLPATPYMLKKARELGIWNADTEGSITAGELVDRTLIMTASRQGIEYRPR